MRPRKNVLVTGASTGIGRAIAEFLAQKGFKVYAGGRKPEDLQALDKLNNVHAVKLDVTSDREVGAAVELVGQQDGALFALVNNAGIAKAGAAMDLPAEDLAFQLEVNLVGVHRVTRAFFPLLLRSRGRILMISSGSGKLAIPFLAPYCTSKFALEGYSDSLRQELAPLGVHVSIIHPGMVKTPIWDKAANLMDGVQVSPLFEARARKVGSYAIGEGKQGLPPISTAKTVYRALTQKRPATRYIQRKNKIRSLVTQLLPDRLIDRLIARQIEKM